jgi:hypothetical protein
MADVRRPGGHQGETGKVLWRKEWAGEQFHLSGKFVYVSRAQVSKLDQVAAAMNDAKVPVHYHIYRLDPTDRKELWDFYQPKAPRSMEPRQNRLLFQDHSEMKLLKFTAL